MCFTLEKLQMLRKHKPKGHNLIKCSGRHKVQTYCWGKKSSYKQQCTQDDLIFVCIYIYIKIYKDIGHNINNVYIWCVKLWELFSLYRFSKLYVVNSIILFNKSFFPGIDTFPCQDLLLGAQSPPASFTGQLCDTYTQEAPLLHYPLRTQSACYRPPPSKPLISTLPQCKAMLLNHSNPSRAPPLQCLPNPPRQIHHTFLCSIVSEFLL